jgi:hypothetical protein
MGTKMEFTSYKHGVHQSILPTPHIIFFVGRGTKNEWLETMGA